MTLPSHHYRMEQLAVSSCFRDAFSLAEKLRSSLDHMTWQRCAETRQRHGATEQSTTWSTPPWLCAHFLSTSHPQLSLGEYVLTAVYRRIILFFLLLSFLVFLGVQTPEGCFSVCDSRMLSDDARSILWETAFRNSVGERSWDFSLCVLFLTRSAVPLCFVLYWLCLVVFKLWFLR